MFGDKNIKYLNLSEIKKLLINKDITKQIKAIRILHSTLCRNSNDEIKEYLISSDIVEILCESMSTLNTYVLKLGFECFQSLIQSSKFYEQHHAAYVLECILRTLYILLSTTEATEITVFGLELIYRVICGLKYLKILLTSVCDISSLIIFIKAILETTDLQIVYKVSDIILNLLSNEELRQYTTDLQQIILKTLKFLLSKVPEDNTHCCFSRSAELLNLSFRNLFTAENGKLQNAEKNGRLFKELLLILKNIFTCYLSKIVTRKEQVNISDHATLVEVILKAMLSVYRFPYEPQIIEYSHCLVSQGFLLIFPQIEQVIGGKGLIMIIRSLILELLSCLSRVVLGNEDWKYYLRIGLEALPIGGSYNLVVCDGLNTRIPPTFIIYNYFVFLSSENSRVKTEFLKQISMYITLAEQLSAPLTKTVWFVFAVAYLCNSKSCQYSKTVVKSLLKLIGNFEIHEIYTHHPALLYWAFADAGVPHELKIKIVSFWISGDDDESIQELKSFLKLSVKPAIILVEIMGTVDKNQGEIIMNILRSTSENRDPTHTEEIYEQGWLILHQTLSTFIPNTQNFEGLINLIEYCTDNIPKGLEEALIFKICCLLPGVFSKYFHKMYSCSNSSLEPRDINKCISVFKFLNILSLTSIDNKNKRVLAILSSNKELFECINKCILEENSDLSTIIMELLTSLIQFTQNKKSTQVKLEVERLLKFLNGDYALCTATLTFLAAYLEVILAKPTTPVVNISFPTKSQLRLLYLQIHMLCAKMNDEMAAVCWCCLRYLLILSQKLDLAEHLASLPYTGSLFRYCKGPKARVQTSLFLRAWAPLLPRPYSRSLRTPASLREIRHISATASPDSKAGLIRILKNND